MPSLIFVAVAAFLWIIIALLLDRFVLSLICLQCANAVTADLTFKFPGLNLSIPPISLLVLLILPIVVWSVCALPWRTPLNGDAWKSSLTRSVRPLGWLLVALLIPMFGHFIYTITSEYLPKGITKLAESVALQIKVEVSWPGYKSHIPGDFNASLAGFLGFVIGVYFFLRNGLQSVSTVIAKAPHSR